jgi:alkanesulfonate monooxygenase SsuD/methylene tetrahydromethanopterin reductase-like flavin-dependent oxidoreductase (luciferase family)
MKEYVECLRLLISGEKVNYHGKFFRVNNFKIMSPSKRKNIPIFIAAVNKNMMSLASEIADGVLLYLRPVDELKKTVSELKKTTKGRDFEIATSFICAVSDKEPDKARERAAKTLAFYVSVGKYYSKFLSESGFQEEVDNITSAYGKGGSDAARRFVSDSMLDSLAICGSRKDCQKSLAKFLATGITLAIMQVNPVTDSEGSFREMLSTF